MAKKHKKTNKNTFNIGNFVLAKVKGHSLWPAIIEEIPKPGKYVVRFFVTDELGINPLQIKPFNVSELDPNTRKEDLKLAYELCQKQYEKIASLPIESPDESPRNLEIDNDQNAIRAASPKVSPDGHTSEQRELDNDGKVTEPSPSVESSAEEHMDIDSKQTIKKTSPISKTNQHALIKHSETESKQETTLLKPKLEESTPVDCSLNDLTSEQANADHGIKKPVSKKSETVPDNSKVKTIEKLKKKLQEKLDEKEDKKKHRREKKKFEKASRLLPKVTKKYQVLITSGKMFVVNTKDLRNASLLKSSIKSCENSLDLLTRCVIAISSEFGRVQKESKQFHSVLKDLIETLNAIRSTNVRPISKDAKHFKSKFKNREAIKEFINKFDTSLSETKEEQIVERKENARKRTKLSR